MSQAGNSSIPKRTMIAAGQRYGRLTVLEFLERRSRANFWRLRCDCGQEHIARTALLRNGTIQSCGCLRNERVAANGRANRTHGMSGLAIYRTWTSMHTRCYNSKEPSFARYGGRGIAVCEHWHKFENFYADMGIKPSRHHSLERVDNDGNYCKENCTWATKKEQSRNKRNNLFVTINGNKMVLIDACRKANLSYNAIRARITKLGWSADRALSTPVYRTRRTK